MYGEYFKLSEPPFSLTPDPRYLFMSERHREGLAHLLYGVQQPGGFVQLTGEIGSGKTTLCRCLIKQLPPDTDVALILNPRLTVIELLAAVCDELRISYPAETDSIKVLIDALNQRLLETHAQRRRTVLIIDEAQNLHPEVLEQIRLLTNLETSEEKLLQIILIGQPELLSILKEKKLRQLAQRITARCHLLPLSRRETYAYIKHRLLVAGRREPLFTGPAMFWVYRLSGGVPRVINIICDRALLGAYSTDKRRVGAAIVCQASRETQGLVPLYRRLRLAWIGGIALAILLMMGSAFFFNPAYRSILSRKSISEAAKSSSNPAQPKSVPAASNASTGLRFAEILANTSARENTASSFADLYARWGIKPDAKVLDSGCKADGVEGLECFSQTGNWPKLRRFDLPAILEFILPKGERRRATLIALDKETAVLVIGGREWTLPLMEIDRVWEGSFTILWKPPFAARQLSYGSRGQEIRWLRQTLDRLDGKTPNPEISDLYDEDLQQRIKAFQRQQALIPDGRIGKETLARLVLALEGSNVPSLSRRVR
jgi:general secretion pathway protein A